MYNLIVNIIFGFQNTHIMIKRLLFLIITLSTVNAFAQDTTGLNNIIRLIDKGNIIQAKQDIDKANTVKNSENATYWLYRGVVFHEIYESNDTKVKALADNPLHEAYKSYLNARKYDLNKKYISNIVTALGYVTNEFTQEGINSFNNGDYKSALADFESSIAINSLPEIMYTDTILFYNSALASEKVKDYDKAIGYYKKCIELKFGEGKIYIDLANVYKEKGDIDTYLYTLKEGLAFFPDDPDLINELINHYISVSDVDNTIIYTKRAIAKDSTNSNLYFILGSMYESKKNVDAAKLQYIKAIDVDSTNTDAAFNLGVIYYNSGVDKIKHATTKAEKKQAEYEYTRALIYIEKVHEKEPNSRDVLYMLKNIYRINGDDVKKAEIEKKISELN